MDFTNKVVLVTGSSTGIGRATALLFAKYGAKVALVAPVGEETTLHEVSEACASEHSNQPLVILADLATNEGCDKTATQTLQHFGRLDILVNNAGTTARTTLQDADMETFDRVFNLNVRAVYNLSRQLVPALIESKGNIVNVSSISAMSVAVGNLPYSMAKVTNLAQRATGWTEEQYLSHIKEMEKNVPMGRACSAHDIAQMIVHLASDNSALVTGALVPVDGGVQFVVGALGSQVYRK